MSFGSFLYGSFRHFGGPQEILVICSFAWFLHRNASFRLGGTRQSLFFTDGPNLGHFSVRAPIANQILQYKF